MMQTIITVFSIIALGLLIGRISIKRVSLGSSAILLVALVFGHFGVEIPGIIRNLGLALFAVSAGLMAGPTFFRNFRKKAATFIFLGVFCICAGMLATVAVCSLFEIPGQLAVGLFNGAMTSTPGLGAALEATGDSMISIGYGIAYPFGVVGVVLFIQLFPRIARTDLKSEVEKFREELSITGNTERKRNSQVSDTGRRMILSSPTGFVSCCLILVAGLLVGMVNVPLSPSLCFSLGISGGPIFVGIIAGHFRHIGPISLEVPGKSLSVLRELGISLLLAGAGTDAGNGFVATVSEYGWQLFAYGAFITIVPMVLATFIARKLFRLNIINTLGSICGGMSSSPALGALIDSCGTEDVVSSYAATYPFALIAIIIASQLMAITL